jgi:hypothetical protein
MPSKPTCESIIKMGKQDEIISFFIFYFIEITEKENRSCHANLYTSVTGHNPTPQTSSSSMQIKKICNQTGYTKGQSTGNTNPNDQNKKYFSSKTEFYLKGMIFFYNLLLGKSSFIWTGFGFPRVAVFHV